MRVAISAGGQIPADATTNIAIAADCQREAIPLPGTGQDAQSHMAARRNGLHIRPMPMRLPIASSISSTHIALTFNTFVFLFQPNAGR